MTRLKNFRNMLLIIVILPASIIGLFYLFSNPFIEIDTDEIDKYYDLLSDNSSPSEYFMLNLGISENDDSQIALDRLNVVLGLTNYSISLDSHNEKTPPAFVKNTDFATMSISIYKNISQKREIINLLTHELGHIYVWELDPSIISDCDEEKLVDSSGVFLGLGVLILNGFTDDITYMPGESYHTEKKFYGYLKPDQFGYLLARYAFDHRIEKETIMPYLLPAGRKYFDIGYTNFLKRNNTISPAKPVIGLYWCPSCGYLMKVPLTGIMTKKKCPKCVHPLPISMKTRIKAFLLNLRTLILKKISIP
jgi:hypothetical protein